MERYNASIDEGYKNKDNYKRLKGPMLEPGNSYVVAHNNPIPNYKISQEDMNSAPKRSKCPMGAALGAIGTCCGMKCTRACAIEVN